MLVGRRRAGRLERAPARSRTLEGTVSARVEPHTYKVDAPKPDLGWNIMALSVGAMKTSQRK